MEPAAETVGELPRKLPAAVLYAALKEALLRPATGSGAMFGLGL